MTSPHRRISEKRLHQVLQCEEGRVKLNRQSRMRNLGDEQAALVERLREESLFISDFLGTK